MFLLGSKMKEVRFMCLINWCKQNNADQDMIDWLINLTKKKPYTDEEIIEAINKVYELNILTLKETVALICGNETMELK
jgi:hypothetical protein